MIQDEMGSDWELLQSTNVTSAITTTTTTIITTITTAITTTTSFFDNSAPANQKITCTDPSSGFQKLSTTRILSTGFTIIPTGSITDISNISAISPRLSKSFPIISTSIRTTPASPSTLAASDFSALDSSSCPSTSDPWDGCRSDGCEERKWRADDRSRHFGNSFVQSCGERWIHHAVLQVGGDVLPCRRRH
ncbi:hypothetical protein ElyMa_003138600 [Elysia marginata]|uniref:Uncharacterized protein n=1 Tax=Elysia marginata TaxID=1093978 RepID=A0AAV4ITS4_9GAST|nr:hypothetical protein ElyMa_003138600 [Elysia marginata]